jgi:hypothetical protein
MVRMTNESDALLVHSFDTLEQAAAGVNALVQAGISHGAIELRVIEDESGPAEGNFIIGNGRTAHGRPPGALRTGDDVPYEENFRRVVHRGVHLVLVRAADEAQRHKLDAVLEREGGRAVQELAESAR